jgi:hypothetical protein
MAVVIFGAMAVWVRLNRVPVMAAGDRRAPIRRVAAVRHVDEAAPAATGTAPTSGAVQAIWPS